MAEAEKLRRGVLTSYSTADAVEKYTQRASEGLRNYEKVAIDRFFPLSGKILVIGCGAGREAFALETLGYKVKGIDISENLITAAKSIANQRHSHVEFELTNGTNISEPDRTYDIVIFWSQILANVPTKEARQALLQEAFRILVAGGLASLTVHDRTRTLRLLEADSRYERINQQGLDDGDVILKEGGKDPVFWHYFDKSEVQNLFVEAGFHDSRILRVSELGESWDNVLIGFGRKS